MWLIVYYAERLFIIGAAIAGITFGAVYGIVWIADEYHRIRRRRNKKKGGSSPGKGGR